MHTIRASDPIQNVSLVCYQLLCRDLGIVDLQSMPWRNKWERKNQHGGGGFMDKVES